MENKYWVIGSNKWSKSIYTKEEAEEYAKTLINCKWCINCKFCRDCVNCRDLFYCENCFHCYLCGFSEALKSCEEVFYSYNLVGAKKVEREFEPDFGGAE